MEHKGREVKGTYLQSKFNLAVLTRVGIKLQYNIIEYYDTEEAANRRANGIRFMYGEVIVLPPVNPTKGK